MYTDATIATAWFGKSIRLYSYWWLVYNYYNDHLNLLSYQFF